MSLRRLQDRRRSDLLLRCLAWTRTAEHQRRLDEARRSVDDWLSSTENPAVSCSGGKDSSLTLLLARDALPSIPVYRADPPNPLSDRPAHVASLLQAAGGDWRIVPYVWDVESVLSGDERYPSGLKVRRLVETMRIDGIGGVALGVRADESRSRRIHVATRGLVYEKADGLRVCQPIARWSAEAVIGELLRRDALPLNPVYRRLASTSLDLGRIRDGTWWPVAPGQREWISSHYPEHLRDFQRAEQLKVDDFRKINLTLL